MAISWSRRAYFNNIDANGLNIFVMYWFAPPDYWDYMEHAQHVNMRIVQEFEKAGISFAIPAHATEMTSQSGLPNRPSSALRQQLHSPAMRLLPCLEYERLFGARWSTYFVRIPQLLGHHACERGHVDGSPFDQSGGVDFRGRWNDATGTRSGVCPWWRVTASLESLQRPILCGLRTDECQAAGPHAFQRITCFNETPAGCILVAARYVRYEFSRRAILLDV